MKNLNETEFNEKCAKFLDYKLLEGMYYGSVAIPKDTLHLGEVLDCTLITKSRFSTDWNWLQEVKAKICSLKIVDEFNTKYDSVAKGWNCGITPGYNDTFRGFFSLTYSTELEATLDIIQQFLTWYENHV